MKKLILICAALLSAHCSFSQTGAKPEPATNAALLQRIMYFGEIQYESGEQIQRNWWLEALEPSAQHKFFSEILHKVITGKLPVYQTDYPYTKQLSPVEVGNRIAIYDTIEVVLYPNMPPVEKVTVDTMRPEYIRYIVFDEEWRYDPTNKQFLKKVKGLLLYSTLSKGWGSKEKVTKPLFYIPLNDAGSMEENDKTLLTGRIAFDAEIFPSLENADTSNAIRFLSTANRTVFPAALFEEAKAGKIPVYDPVYPNTRVLSKEEVNRICQRIDTAIVSDPFDPSKQRMGIAKGPVTAKEINSLRFYESWYFDAGKMTMSKKVRGAVLLHSFANGAVKEMFYVPFNNSEKETQVSRPTVINQMECAVAGIGIRDSGDTQKGMDTAAFFRFTAGILNDVKTGQTPVFDSYWHEYENETNPYPYLLTEMDLKDILYSTDSIIVNSDLNNPSSPMVTKAITLEKDMKQINGMMFNEEWNFNPEGMKFTKTARGIKPLFRILDYSGNYNGKKELFYFPMNTVNVAPEEKDESIVLGKDVSYVIPVRDLDLIDTTWNIPYIREYIEMSKRESMIKRVMDDVMTGKTKAFIDDQWHLKTLKPAEVKALLVRTVSKKTAKQPEKTVPLTYQDINAIKFYESWTYDKTKNIFIKKVKGIVLGMSEGNPDSGKFKMFFYVPVNQ